MHPFMFFDPTMIIVLPGILLALWAQFATTHTFKKWAEVSAGIDAKEVAERILEENGITDVSVRYIPGELSDHYDPRNKVLCLSDSTYHSDSVAAVAVAAHEAGHAIQHHKNYFPLIIRNAIVPIVNFASMSWIFIVFAGIFFQMPQLIKLGVYVFGSMLAFSLITLPVEFDASARALKILKQGYFGTRELKGAKAVLNAAAMTYVASAIISLLQFLRILLLTSNRNE